LSPSSPDRQQLGTEEMKESPLTGPFGGIQSELPISLIEDYGFADCQNLAFRFGTAQNRPTYTTLPAPPGLIFGEYITTFAAFWDSLGLRRQVAFTNVGHVYDWSGVAWTLLTGPALGPLTNGSIPFTWSVLNQKLCFANGGPFNSDQVYLYDPQAAPGVYTLSSANSQEPFAIAEIGVHLMTVDVNVIGTGLKPQRYQWSGAGDPTDWTSFSAGINDELVDLGPGYGLLKLGQYGFGFHPNGILQIISTGTGAAPFAFVPIMGGDVGPTALFSLQKLNIGGYDNGIFAGPDNVYTFNQTVLSSIGAAPIGQRRWLGARQRIMADLKISGPLGNTRSHRTHSPGASPFMAYYLLCVKNVGDPTQCPLWVYNFDEENWTRWIFNKVPVALGDFSLQTNTFVPDQGDKIGISFVDGTVGYIDFSQAGSEVSYSVKSGKLIFKDRRHRHTNKKFRLVFTDLGSVTWTLTLINEAGQNVQQTITLGTGSNDDLTYIFSVPIPGLRIQYTLTAPAGSLFDIVELSPMFDIAGEQRGGTVDNN
jgi:hypothetical protein